MPRKLELPLDFQPNDPQLWDKRAQLQTIVREYRLITPLFGGGDKPRYADAVTTVRTAEIKGQLRFWWRAIRGWQAQGSLKDLLEREESIWGGVTHKRTASKVALAVETLAEGEKKEPFKYVADKKVPKSLPHIAPAYLAFPLQPTKEDRRIYPLRVGVRFKLYLTFPSEYEQEVNAALWAWETFGGIGARTRRGFGAVIAEGSKPPSLEAIRKKLDELIEQDTWPEGVPHLRPNGILYLFPKSWQDLADRYRNFRQWRNGNRGRSKWPEPDEIRRLVNTHSLTHHPPIHKFPRAQFGLPIIFHFKDKKKGDPSDVTLKGKKHERLASPLGFKPLGEKGPVLVYVLEGSRRLPEGYQLITQRGAFDVEVELGPQEAAKIEPLKVVGNETDPVKAFVKWLQLQQGGKR